MMVVESTNGKSNKNEASTKCFSIQDVEMHNTCNDFWTVIDNAVYDLSGYRDEHPGGHLIMSAAGADSTVLFHQYHLWEPEKARKVLEKFRIGVLKRDVDDPSSFTSPNMGDFWHVTSKRVVAHLRKEKLERRPFYAKLMWFVDFVVLSLMYCIGFTFLVLKRDETAPLWLLMVLHVLTSCFTMLRGVGQMHASGHGQLWEPKSRAQWYAEQVGICLGMASFHSFSLPNSEKNSRTMLNQPRHVSQFELHFGRGFSEHTAIHHVKGAKLEHDQCLSMVSVYGLSRFCETTLYRSLFHRFQATFVGQVIQTTISEVISDGIRVLFIFPHIFYTFKEFLPHGEYIRSLTGLIGMGAAPLSSWCYLALPCSGAIGFGLFVVLCFLRNILGVYPVQVFFAQHVWDYPDLPEAVIDQDWGRHNVESSCSWHPTRADQWLHPLLWGSLNGSCAGTLTYHLEHTLFPSLNYRLLPHIAPIVRESCREFGYKYHAFYSTEELLQCRLQNLEKYSACPHSKKHG